MWRWTRMYCNKNLKPNNQKYSCNFKKMVYNMLTKFILKQIRYKLYDLLTKSIEEKKII